MGASPARPVVLQTCTPQSPPTVRLRSPPIASVTWKKILCRKACVCHNLSDYLYGLNVDSLVLIALWFVLATVYQVIFQMSSTFSFIFDAIT